MPPAPVPSLSPTLETETGSQLRSGSGPPSPRRRWLAALFLLLCLATLPPFFNLSSYRGRVAGAIGRSLGRQVAVGQVRLRLLPQPGFLLENLVVSEDPAFGAEPMLRAGQVTTSLRLASLWRGRLEIATLSLSEPSFNLVRAADGHWNLEGVLLRASQVPAAPTAQTRPEARPRFPYLQVENGRINLKLRQEKTVYALEDADFALWLASENEWRLRLDARPMRSDVSLSDTGRIKVTGSFQRAAALHPSEPKSGSPGAPALRNTPLKLRITLENAQLGQLTKLIYGRDRGWRGAANLSAELVGTPASLAVRGDLVLNDFRRYDISRGEALRLQAHCAAHYRAVEDQAAEQNSASDAGRASTLSGIRCRLPLDSGEISLSGNVSGPEAAGGARRYDLKVAVREVPVPAAIALARHMKHDLPDDLTSPGVVDAFFTLAGAGEPGTERAQWSGAGAATNLRLRSAALGPELALGTLRFAIQSETPAPPAVRKLQGRKRRPQVMPTSRMEARNLIFGPISLSLDGPAPATVQAAVSTSGYHIVASGEGELGRIFSVARALGLRAPQSLVQGNAKFDLTISGNWAGFAPPAVAGTALLRKVRLEIPGIASPLELASAGVTLTEDSVALDSISAALPRTRMLFEGWLTAARHCDSLERCPVRFDLRANELDFQELNRLLNPQSTSRIWSLLGGSQPRSAAWLTRLPAAGRLTANRVSLGPVMATSVSAQVRTGEGKMDLGRLRADIFAGKHDGDWKLDFTGTVPAYSAHGALSGVSLGQTSLVLRDNWAAGVGNASYDVVISGSSAGELAASASGSMTFDLQNGAFRHIALTPGDGPLEFSNFSGKLKIRQGELEFVEGKLQAPGGIYSLSGTATFGRQLDLKLMQENGQVYSITGSLERPRVAAEITRARAAASQ